MDQFRADLAASPPLVGSYNPRKGATCAAQFSDGLWYVIYGQDNNIFMISFTNLHLGCQFAGFECKTSCETMVISNLSKEIISIPVDTVMIMYFPQASYEMTVCVAMTACHVTMFVCVAMTACYVTIRQCQIKLQDVFLFMKVSCSYRKSVLS